MNFKKRETDPYAVGAPVYDWYKKIIGTIVEKNNKGWYKIHWSDGTENSCTYSSVIILADNLWDLVKDND